MVDEATQVAASQKPRFTLQWAGDKEPGVPIALDVLLEANKDDPELCEWLRSAPLTGIRMTAGGAAPACAIRRVS